jgi:predicted nucleotide-binding protein (sugar kinase/HSP70/actin superfamily)
MKITFPHMGTLSIILETLLTEAGHTVLTPPANSKAALELGARHSPETVCLPFKLNLGNFIQALDAGADTILTCGGFGPCRLGYYAEIQREILRDCGYSFDLIVVEPTPASVWQAVRRVAVVGGWRRTWQAFRLAAAKLTALDAVERAACSWRPRTAVPAEVDAITGAASAAIAAAVRPDEAAAATDACRRQLGRLPARPGQPLKLGLVGEIYVTLEPLANQDIVRRLGHLGAEVRHTMLLGDYLRGHILRQKAATAELAEIHRLAAPYLGHFVGGHGVKSVGNAVRLARAGFDGIVHLFPFTCMPEVIAKNILPAISAVEGIPVLSLAVDEQTGDAGLVTRLEAFLDLLAYRRSKKA